MDRRDDGAGAGRVTGQETPKAPPPTADPEAPKASPELLKAWERFAAARDAHESALAEYEAAEVLERETAARANKAADALRVAEAALLALRVEA
jgi:hypothetical protein